MRCPECDSDRLHFKSHQEYDTYTQPGFYQEWWECGACGHQMTEQEALTEVI